MSSSAIGWLALATSTLAAATYSPFAKSLSPLLSPLSLIFVSECLVLAFVFLSFGALPVLKTCLRLRRTDIMWLLCIGSLNGIVGPMLWFTGLSLTSVVNASFFGKTELMFMLPLAAWFLGERITRTHIMALCTIFAGLILISLQGFSQSLSIQLGDAIIVLSTLTFACGTCLYRKHLRHIEPHIALASRSVIAVSAFFFISPFIQHPFIAEVLSLPGTLLPILLAFGFVSRFVNSVAYYEALDRLPVSTISLVCSLDVILTTTVAYAMLGEQVYWYHFVGGAFVIMGTLLLEFIGTHPNDAELERHLKHRMP